MQRKLGKRENCSTGYSFPVFMWRNHLSYPRFMASFTVLNGYDFHLCDCADLGTSFSYFEKRLLQPEIKVHLEILFIFRSVLLDLQSFTENLFLSVFLLIR